MVLVLIVSIGWAFGRRGTAFNSLAAAGLVVLALQSVRFVSRGNPAFFPLRGRFFLVRFSSGIK